jgi:hypothetical protein
MVNHLENMARRLEGDPFFLACPLKLYAESEGLDEEALAISLKCSEESLLQVRLCRTPVAEAKTFHQDVQRIAIKFSVDADALALAVRRGQAIAHMRAGRVPNRGSVIAARDMDRKKKPRRGGA